MKEKKKKKESILSGESALPVGGSAPAIQDEWARAGEGEAKQRATKGFSARNGSQVRYLILGIPFVPTQLPTVGPIDYRLPG